MDAVASCWQRPERPGRRRDDGGGPGVAGAGHRRGSVGAGWPDQELTLPGFWHDVCSAATRWPWRRPLRASTWPPAGSWPSPRWSSPTRDRGGAAVVTRSVAETAARLGPDGCAYRRRRARWPARRRGPRGDPGAAAQAARTPAVSYGRRATPPRWPGAGTPTRPARSWRTAAHAMMPLTAVPTAGDVGPTPTGLAHAAGWPVVAGGSARITDAMAAALTSNGGRIETGGLGIRTLAELPAAARLLLDVSPRALDQLAGDRPPGAGTAPRCAGTATGPAPRRMSRCRGRVLEACRKAGTLHLAAGSDRVAAAEAEVAAGQHPREPYVLVVQPGVADQPGSRPCGTTATRRQGPTWTSPAGSRPRSSGSRPASATSSWPARHRGLRAGAQPELRRRRHRGRPADAAADDPAPGAQVEPVPYAGPRRLPVLLGRPAGPRGARPVRRAGRADRAAGRVRRPRAPDIGPAGLPTDRNRPPRVNKGAERAGLVPRPGSLPTCPCP